MKETIIKSIKGGKEVQEEIKVLRRVGHDYRQERGRTEALINQIHPDALSLKVVEIIEVTKGAKLFRLASTTGYLPPYQSGQYVNLFVEIDGVRTSRPYSISYTPSQRKYYDVIVGRIENGFVSDYFLDEVKVGDIIEGNGPAGQFYYNPVFHGKKQVFLAGGSGITPFIGMMCDVLHEGLDREIHLIYGCRNKESVLFLPQFEDFANRHDNFTLTLVLSETTEDHGERQGFIDRALIQEVIPDIKEQMFYICGPSAMTDFCLRELKVLSVKEKRIRKEMFGAKKDISQEPGWPTGLSRDKFFEVKVNTGKENKRIKAKAGESLLTALERHGLRVNVCCRTGECSFCRIQLVSGKVFAPKGVLTRYADEKYGYIHSCQAYPIEDIEIML